MPVVSRLLSTSSWLFACVVGYAKTVARSVMFDATIADTAKAHHAYRRRPSQKTPHPLTSASVVLRPLLSSTAGLTAHAFSDQHELHCASCRELRWFHCACSYRQPRIPSLLLLPITASLQRAFATVPRAVITAHLYYRSLPLLLVKP